jgi:hypothetical protein
MMMRKLKLYIHLFITQFMSKKVLINIIGKVFTDSDFRKKFRTDIDSTLDPISGLTPKEKIFLKKKRLSVVDFSKALNLSYKGENKRR